MKLVKFSVTNFRSIAKAHNIPISDTTVLVGKNNEGKSNLLQALSTAMNLIHFHAHASRHPRYSISRRYFDDIYEWKRDFPISQQSKRGNKKTVFDLEFELTPDEIRLFKAEIKSNLNGTLPLKITVGDSHEYKIKVNKGGRGSKTLNAKAAHIASYIAKRISFNYIPAIRTHKQALDVIERLLSKELSTLESNPAYKKALETIEGIQRPVLAELSEKIKTPLSEFLPNITDVQINISEDIKRTRYRRNFEVIVNDGTPTSIEYKGDGVKSLAALGLLKNKSYQSDASIIAIEEPESHLHPGAIHQLQKIITSLETDNQIVLSTHNPLFVNRKELQSNIIVANGKAILAKNIESIRDNLGVRVSDNLTHARFTLVVEGAEDVTALQALLPSLSNKIKTALKNHSLTILPIQGAGKLSYQLTLLQSQLCVYHVLLDNDNAANIQKKAALDNGLIRHNQLTQTTCPGMHESEFEDCLDTAIYKDKLSSQYRLDLSCSEFRSNQNKWSERIKNTCTAQGVVFDTTLLSQIKSTVARCVVNAPTKALNTHKRGSIDAMISAIENMLDS